MSRTAKIVFIGAASAAFGVDFYRDLFTRHDLAGSTLVLVDLDPVGLERMRRLGERLNHLGGAGLRIETSTDRRAALPGADYVINAAAIARNRLWQQDFAIPKKYGIRHTLGENGGPGGLFFTLRTMPLVFDFARDIEALCPNALFLNLSNPESRLVLGLARYSKVKVLGLCHGIFLARWFICQLLGMKEADVRIWAAGLNHFQWVTALRHRETGDDLYPLLRERDRTHPADFTPLVRRLFRAFGLWPTCSDDHMGEYLAYGWEAGEHGFNFVDDERGRREFIARIEAVNDGREAVPDEWRQPSWGERVVQIIAAHLHHVPTAIEAGIVQNNGVIPNLPADIAVEVPLLVDGSGVHPVAQGPLPDGCARLLQQQAQVQHLAVEAAVRGSRELALQALLVDPVVNSSEAALALLDELWTLNAPYIRSVL